MKGHRRAGFTLIELLIVAVVIIMLMALLMPAAGTAWHRAYMAQCQTNLKRMFEAQNNYRAAHPAGQYATGPSWVPDLVPYLEDDMTILSCPEGGIPWEDLEGVEGAEIARGLTLNDIAWEIYKSGNYLYDIPLSSDFIFVTPGGGTLGSEWTLYEIEDQRTSGDYSSDHKDIVVEVRFMLGFPQEIYFSPHHSGHGYKFKFKIKGEIIHDPAKENGEKLDLSEFGTMPGLAAAESSDYGMSVGVFLTAIEEDLAKPDGKLFFILDYPKVLANYLDPADPVDEWADIFVVDPEENPAIGPHKWELPEEFAALEDAGQESSPIGWQDMTALRHFKRANVLFMDGHVEALGIDPFEDADLFQQGKILTKDSPLWRSYNK